MNLDSSQAAAANSIRIVTSAADGGIDVDAGTGGIAIDSTGVVSIQGAAASDISVGGAGIDLSLVSALGRVIINAEEAAADAVTILSAAGGLDVNVALQMNLDSSQAAVDAIRIFASNAAGGIDVDAGTGGITIDTTGALSLDSAAASNFTVTGAFDLSLISSLGSVVVSAGEAVADAIQLTTGATGGITVNASTGALAINRAVTVSPAAGVNGITVTGLTTGIPVVLASSGATVSALQTTVGGLQVATTSSAAGASPRTVSARHGQAIFTDVIANGAYGTLTITNTIATVNSLMLANASCTTVNSAVQIVEITPAAGSVALRIYNAGSASTAANILVNFWLMSN